MEFNRRIFQLMALFTIIGLSLAGILIIVFFQDRSLSEALCNGLKWHWQILIGLAFGIGIGGIGSIAVNHSVFDEVRFFFNDLFKESDVKLIDIIFISVAAGVGEEILFRAGIQYFLGVWLTSFLFILLHGYMKNSKPWFLISMIMVVISSGLGYLYEFVGLLSAMVCPCFL